MPGAKSISVAVVVDLCWVGNCKMWRGSEWGLVAYALFAVKAQGGKHDARALEKVCL